jgi:hypothetical protein
VALGHTQPCIQWLLGPFPGEIKKWREADRSHLVSNLVEFNNVWSCISTPHTLSWYNGTADKYNMLVYTSVYVPLVTNNTLTSCPILSHKYLDIDLIRNDSRL